MSTIRYSSEHEWVRVDSDDGTVGITEYAQNQLGDIVYVELPDIGKKLAARDQAAVVESVKAASEVYAPVGGTVVAVNDALGVNPALVNESAEEKGWFFKIKLSNKSDLDALMDDAGYRKFVEGLG
ncbi:MAG: glycine cleavage system protein GcvH [Alphaproteobacteria bacterium]|nr:glycine cleavage system protein GcvH [Alphaproteobacteria bacterium]